MIGISKLYLNTHEDSDNLRYAKRENQKPVLVWNMTRSCNLKCSHCYSSSENKKYHNELSKSEAKKFINDIAAFNIPVLLFSGGEPLMHPDFLEFANYAREKGLRTVASTNGTLIDKKMAKYLKDIDLKYAGISLDGTEETNDKFRGVKGAFKKTIRGIENCLNENIKVGLRLTINKYNAKEIPEIFSIMKTMQIPRICFYHMVKTGNADNSYDLDLSLEEKRFVIDTIINETIKTFETGYNPEVLTVDNLADGIYLYLRALKEEKKKADKILEYLKINAAKSTGEGISCVSWDGNVYADQFLRKHPLGNIKSRNFSDIWTSPENDLLEKLRNRKDFITGRCSKCKWLDICKGNFRARAEALTGDLWASDPSCYLLDKEVL